MWASGCWACVRLFSSATPFISSVTATFLLLGDNGTNGSTEPRSTEDKSFCFPVIVLRLVDCPASVLLPLVHLVSDLSQTFLPNCAYTGSPAECGSWKSSQLLALVRSSTTRPKARRAGVVMHRCTWTGCREWQVLPGSIARAGRHHR